MGSAGLPSKVVFGLTFPRFLIVFLVLVSALILRLTFTAVSLNNLPPTGDESLIFLVATEIAAGQWPLLISGTPYQFPVESYLLAPFVDWIPRTAFGIRSLTLIFGCLTFSILMLTALSIFPKELRWPSLLLLCFPSAYWLMIQSGYTPPGYPTVLLCFAITAYVLGRGSSQAAPIGGYLILGLVGGVAFSAHMSALSFVVAAFLTVFFSQNMRHGIRSGAAFITGCLMGAAPVFFSIVLHPGAHEAVSGTVPFAQLLGRLWNPVLLETLPGAMGVNSTLFPDFRPHLNYPHELRRIFLILYLGFVMPLAVYRIARVLQQLTRRQWPTLGMIDFFLLASLFALGLTALSARAQSSSYRYLLIVVASFPFIVGYVYQHAGRFVRRIVGIALAGVIVGNMISSLHLIQWWRQPPFAAQIAATPDIQGLISELKSMGIDRCYASYWHVYRILFESNGDIVCAQPYNERFLGWPVPNKEFVDQAADARFVLTTGYDSRYPVSAFKRHMQDYGIRYERHDVGVFSIFGPFTSSLGVKDRTIPADALMLRSDFGVMNLENLVDSDYRSFWSSKDEQRHGTAVEVLLDKARRIHRVTLHFPFIYPKKPDTHPKSIDIEGFIEGKWVTLVDDHPHRFDRFRFLNQHPVYGGMNQTIWFPDRNVERIRIVINKPNSGRSWELSEVELGEVH